MFSMLELYIIEFSTAFLVFIMLQFLTLYYPSNVIVSFWWIFSNFENKILDCQIPAVNFTLKHGLILIYVILILRWHLAHSYITFFSNFLENFFHYFSLRKSSIIVLSHPNSRITFSTFWISLVNSFSQSLFK